MEKTAEYRERLIIKNMSLPEKTKAERKADFKLFATNFRLIQKYEDLISNTPEYFHILLEELHVGSTSTGASHISLGILLLLWKEGHLVCRCPECDGEAFIFRGGGSLLSGSNSYTALCPECVKTFCGSVCSFGSIYGPATEKKKKYPNKIKFLIKETQRFSWSKGLVGQATSDEILEDGIHPIDFKDLIAKLKEKEMEAKQ